MALLDYRQEQAKELAAMLRKLESTQGVLRDFPDLAEKAAGTAAGAEALEELSKRVSQRLNRVRASTCRVAVIGLEKAGKSTFINAWIGGQALPADRERCTWAASTIRNGSRIQAEVSFASREEFDADVKKLYTDAGLDMGKIPFPLAEDAPSKYPELLPPRVTSRNEYKDIEDLSHFWHEISPQLGRGKLSFTASSVAELRKKIFPYISRLEEGGKKIGTAYAVKQVDIDIPLEDNLEFTIDDLPGVNAPGNRAEEMTFRALRETADAIVFIKNAAANASPDRDETRIWKEADEADTSIRLTERLFVIMSRADEHAVDNGRDAHEQGAMAFKNKGVSPAHIFYCSSTAEIYRAYKKDGGEEPSFIRNPDGSVAYSDRNYEEASKKISSYLQTAEPTSGIPEFEQALYGFLREDFPRLEQRALETLRKEYTSAVEKARELLDAYQRDSLSEGNAVFAEVQRFEKLWGLLTDAIQKIVDAPIREIKESPEALSGFLDGIRERIAASQERFLATITVDAFKNMDFKDKGTAIRQPSRMKSAYFEKTQKALKKEIYEGLASAISQNVTVHLQPIWDKALRANTPEAPAGLSIIAAGERDEELRKSLKRKPNPALEQIFSREDGKEPTITAAGFAALLKSIIDAPLDYFFSSEDAAHNPVRERLLQKAVLYQNGICDEKKKSRLAAHYKKYRGELDKDQNNGFIEMVKGDTALFRDVLDLFLPRPFVTLASVALKAAGNLAKGKDAEEKHHPFAGVRRIENAGGNAQSDQDSRQPETDEEVVEYLKKQVEVFYFVLEAMLFDRDFGFIGYYRSFVEEFREAILEEMDPEGAIKTLAFMFKKEIWPNEAEFRANEERRRVEEKIARFKQELAS
jgi:hypothetical protein